MRPIILALVPVILFVGALLSAGSPPAASDAPQHAAYMPAVDTSAPAQPAQEVQPAEQPAPPAKPEAAPQQPPAPKPVVYAQVTRCSDGTTTAYEYNGTTQIQPVTSKAAQCADPLVVV